MASTSTSGDPGQDPDQEPTTASGTSCACCSGSITTPTSNLKSFGDLISPPPPKYRNATQVTISQAISLIFQIDPADISTQDLWICASCSGLCSTIYYPVAKLRKLIVDSNSIISDSISSIISSSSSFLRNLEPHTIIKEELFSREAEDQFGNETETDHNYADFMETLEPRKEEQPDNFPRKTTPRAPAPGKKSNSTPIRHHGHIKCPICPPTLASNSRLFRTQYALNAHVLSHYMRICKKCNIEFKTRYMLEMHLHGHHGYPNPGQRKINGEANRFYFEFLRWLENDDNSEGLYFYNNKTASLVIGTQAVEMFRNEVSGTGTGAGAKQSQNFNESQSEYSHSHPFSLTDDHEIPEYEQENENQTLGDDHDETLENYLSVEEPESDPDFVLSTSRKRKRSKLSAPSPSTATRRSGSRTHSSSTSQKVHVKLGNQILLAGNDALFPCPYDGCSKFCRNAGALTNHVNLIHDHKNKMGRTTPNTPDFDDDADNKSKIRLPCPYDGCDKICRNPGALTNHVNKIHKRKTTASTQSKTTSTKGPGIQHQSKPRIRKRSRPTPRKIPTPLSHGSDSESQQSHQETKPSLISPELLETLEADGNEKKFWPCPTPGCQKKYLTRRAMRVHVRAHRPKFVTKNGITTIRNPEDRPFPCPVEGCNSSFKFNHALKRHIKECHSEEKYPCPICGKVLSSKKNLAGHSVTHLSDSGPIPMHHCHECGQSYKTPQSLQLHVTNLHRNKHRYPCPQCPKAFSTKFLINTHIEQVHGEPQWTCQFCGKTFKKPRSLRFHEATFHIDQLDPNTALPHECEICNKKFPRRDKLRLHKIKENHHLPGQEPNTEIVDIVQQLKSTRKEKERKREPKTRTTPNHSESESQLPGPSSIGNPDEGIGVAGDTKF